MAFVNMTPHVLNVFNSDNPLSCPHLAGRSGWHRRSSPPVCWTV